MKKLLFAAIALTLVVSACKKKDNGVLASNTFRVGDTTYAVMAGGGFKGTDHDLSASGENSEDKRTIIFYFDGSPLKTATYKVVGNTAPLKANEVNFLIDLNHGLEIHPFLSTGEGSVNVSLTVTNGKISLFMPDARASLGKDTILVSANLSQ